MGDIAFSYSSGLSLIHIRGRTKKHDMACLESMQSPAQKFISEHFGTNNIEIGQKLRMASQKYIQFVECFYTSVCEYKHYLLFWT